jgi:hypothetical protein
MESIQDPSPLQLWLDETVSKASWSPLNGLLREPTEYLETLDLDIDLKLELDPTINHHHCLRIRKSREEWL